MSKQILVAMKSEDRLADILPYLEKVAHPGMNVVLLIPYQVSGASIMSRDGWETVESNKKTMFAWEQIPQGSSSEEQRSRSVERNVFLAQEALRRRGVEIVANVYVGRLRNVIKGYLRKGDVQLVIMRRGFAVWTQELLNGITNVFGMARNPFAPPVALFCPRQAA